MNQDRDTVHTDLKPDGGVPARRAWRDYVYRMIGKEISDITRYYDGIFQWMPLPSDRGELLREIECPTKETCYTANGLPALFRFEGKRFAVLINGVFNHEADIEASLNDIKTSLGRSSRLLLVMYNPYLSPLYYLATRLNLRSGPMPITFITRTDLNNIARLTGYHIVRTRTVAYVPWRMLGIGDVLNRVLKCVPIIRWMSFTYVVVLQPIVPIANSFPSLSCVIPARNERDNIAKIVGRFPELPAKIQLIFVEGGSTDGTWEEIQKIVCSEHPKFEMKALQQQGAGKADAVRLGFAHASGEILTILDADMTMPPELLSRFYDAYCNGHADFINGSRLVYPMEQEAMQFLNRLGNIFFAKALSWVLEVRIGDSLCGTKLFPRYDLARMIAWRARFGHIDPFGDFELLFPAATLGLGIIDIPIQYRARQYGSTNILRFRHGLRLLKMTLLGLRRIKAGPTSHDASAHSS